MAEIDLTRLPAPKVIEELDFETIFERKKANLIALVPAGIRPTIAATLKLESEPLTIDLQQQAYQEIILRQRINQAAAATLLAFAQGSDLDHLAAAKGIERKTIIAADPTTNPPTEAVYETSAGASSYIQRTSQRQGLVQHTKPMPLMPPPILPMPAPSECLQEQSLFISKHPATKAYLVAAPLKPSMPILATKSDAHSAIP